jgi:hypothetical protein
MVDLEHITAESFRTPKGIKSQKQLIMDWVTKKLMQYQLKKAKKQLIKQEYSFMKRAFGDMVKSYESTIKFLEANT